MTITIAEATIDDMERRGQHLSKEDYYRLLDQLIDEIAIRKEAVGDELREAGVDPENLR